jgi:hypothetical protein
VRILTAFLSQADELFPHTHLCTFLYRRWALEKGSWRLRRTAESRSSES